MRVSILGLVAAAATGACATEATGPRPDGVDPISIHANRVLETPGTSMVSAFVTYRPDAPVNRRALIKQLGAGSAHDISEHRLLAVTLPKAASARLHTYPWIERLEIDSSPPARVSGLVTGDLVTWGLDAIGAPQVHASLGNEGAGVRVAVLDTRVRCDHADLAGRIGGGYDFVDETNEVCPRLWDAVRYHPHGTAVAGIIAGTRNGVGVLGVAPQASLYIARVCDDDGNCSRANVVAALYRMVKAGVQVVNMSLSSGCGKATSQEALDALRNLFLHGVSVVAAAGNGVHSNCSVGTTVGGYSAGEGVITVTHWLPGDVQRPDYQYGPLVDIAAPASVPTAHPTSAVSTTTHPGTSFSAPHVSGALALLIGEGFSGPSLLARRLFETATDRGAAGWDDHWGWGTLDAAMAVARRPVVTALVGPDAPINRAGTYRLTATVAYGAAPIGVRWSVAYSSPAVATNYTTIGGLTHNLSVPEGDYAISVTATPLETIYGRTGSGRSLGLPVCTSGDGGGNPYVLKAKGGGIRPSRVAGC